MVAMVTASERNRVPHKCSMARRDPLTHTHTPPHITLVPSLPYHYYPSFKRWSLPSSALFCTRKRNVPLLSLKPIQISSSIPRNPIALDKSISSLIALRGTVLNYCFSLLMCFLADPAVR